MTEPRYRRPEIGPTDLDVQNRDRFQALVLSSVSEARGSAEKWRAGMAALVTLVTAGLLLKGPDAAQELTTAWRLILTVLAVVGLGAAVTALWFALRASAGVPGDRHLDDIVARHASVAAFEVAQAQAASIDLRRARHAMKWAVIALAATVISWWWAAVEPTTPPAYIKLDVGARSVCGELLSGDRGNIRLRIAGESSPRVLPYSRVQNMYVEGAC